MSHSSIYCYNVIECSFCKSPIRKVASQMRYAHHFCNKKCQDNYRVCSPILENKEFDKRVSWPSNEILKESIWNRPVTTVAKELGVSDKAVKKRCVKRGIITPGPGYWAKLLAV